MAVSGRVVDFILTEPRTTTVVSVLMLEVVEVAGQFVDRLGRQTVSGAQIDADVRQVFWQR